MPEDLPKDTHVFLMNLITKRVNQQEQVVVMRRVVDRMSGDAEAANLVIQLCPKPPYPQPTLPYTLPQKSASPCSDPHCGQPLRPGSDIDVALVESIVSNNVFGVASGVTYMEFKPKSSAKDKAGAALYLLPSLFNHSCAPNASRQFFGDVMVIRALVDIPAGTQVYISYTNEREDRQTRALENWNVVCNCAFCTEYRSQPSSAREKRAALLDEWEEKFPQYRQRNDVKAMRKLLDSIRQTYPNNMTVPIHETSQIHHAIATCLQELAFKAQGSPSLYYEAIGEEISALEASGFRVVDKSVRDTSRPGGFDPHHRSELPIERKFPELAASSNPFYVMTCIMISACFLALDDKTRAERWLRAAWWSE